ncbi:MAG: hypothetical protein KTR33_05555 [Gammaproteobacteria bacterium]|nr:hypothetical protein [Gammaproteobacteria bacterium]
MAYLLTQILLCLALAMVAGACIGWLINGFRGARREHKIREELIRQSLALNQAETDNKMIEDDYRELKYRSEESIALLKEETRQVPVLQENLEKSQTLVRQMLQKHEAEQRQVQSENNQLAVRLKELENRERAVAKLQMELNTERLNRQRDNDRAPVTTDVLTTSDTELPDVEPTADIQPAENQEAAKPPVAQTEMPLDELESQVEAAVQQAPHNLAEAISELEAVHEKTAPDPLTELTLDAERLTDTLSGMPFAETADVETEDLEHKTTAAEPADDELAAIDAHETGQLVDDYADNDEQTEPAPYDFGPTEREDNLQEIFGIGPVAERALRKLGITSFAQLASLEREHIEFIADQLDIFPGRIERDDWVGSAQRRLEQEDATETDTSDEPELEDA